MLSPLEYTALKTRLELHCAWVNSLRQHPGAMVSYDPELEPLESRISNDESAQVEFYEFFHDKPARYLAYESGLEVTTWTGLALGRILRRNNSWRNNFGDRRYSYRALGFNGVFYSVLGHGNQMYCHLRAYQNQAAKQREYRAQYEYWNTIYHFST